MNVNVKRLVIAIDGPAGSGKSTVAKRLAELVGYVYIDTGAMYRALTLKAIRTATPLNDEAALVKLARGCSIELMPAAGGGLRVLLDGEDVSDDIRTLKVSSKVSQVSAVPGVRDVLVEKQRQMGAQGGVVVEGRDIQTVVFPDADLKVFLTATTQERARRRWLELKDKGHDLTLQEVVRQTQERDTLDSTRQDSPLCRAMDAVELDTTKMTVEEVVQRIRELAGLLQ